MTASTTDQKSLGEDADAVSLDGSGDDEATRTLNALAVASVALSGMGFITLLRLADRTDRTPARALRLFFATSVESVSGGVLGLHAASRLRDSDEPGKGFLIAAAGAVLGVITTVLNINWMRTRRRL